MNRFAKFLCRQELRALEKCMDIVGGTSDAILACEAVSKSPQMFQLFCERVQGEYDKHHKGRLASAFNGGISLALLAKFLREYGPTIVRIAMLVFSMMSGRSDAELYSTEETCPEFQRLKEIMESRDFKSRLAYEHGQLSREIPDAAVMWMCTDDEGGVT